MPNPLWRRRTASIVTALAATLLLASGCTSVVRGEGGPKQAAVAKDADVTIIGAVGSEYDKLAANAAADLEKYWAKEFPTLSGGAAYPPLSGGIYSVAGNKGNSAEACMKRNPAIVADNAMYCFLDDSVFYDREGRFINGMLDKTGPIAIAAVFAHEWGHVVQHPQRLDYQWNVTTYAETQADCFAGSFIGWALEGNAPHFRVKGADLDLLLSEYINLRDPVGYSPDDEGSHGNGFDRISAFADGIENGASYCVDDWENRELTERPYTSDADYLAGGDLPYSDALREGTTDLERFWTSSFQEIGKTWKPVTVKSASGPSCNGKTLGQIGYCAKDNAVYYTDTFLQQAYKIGDFAPMTLIGLGYGLAVSAQLGDSVDGSAALLAAACYQGAYAYDINVDDATASKLGLDLYLSPADMDEASVAILQFVRDEAFGARGTTGYERIQAFTTGYFGGLGEC